MMRTLYWIVAASLLALPAQADEVGRPKLQAVFEEFRVRLTLTLEQQARVRSIFEAQIKAQLETLDKYDGGERADAASIGLQEMRALREELRGNSARIEHRLAEVLSGAQMAEYRRIRAEQNGKLREQFMWRGVDQIVAKLSLTAEQAGRARPILKEHFKAQMAILDKHGIAPGQRDSAGRPGFRALRALRRDMRRHNSKTEERLSMVLSKDQLAEFETLQAEQRKKLRALLFER